MCVHVHVCAWNIADLSTRDLLVIFCSTCRWPWKTTQFERRDKPQQWGALGAKTNGTDLTRERRPSLWLVARKRPRVLSRSSCRRRSWLSEVLSGSESACPSRRVSSIAAWPIPWDTSTQFGRHQLFCAPEIFGIQTILYTWKQLDPHWLSFARITAEKEDRIWEQTLNITTILGHSVPCEVFKFVVWGICQLFSTKRGRLIRGDVFKVGKNDKRQRGCRYRKTTSINFNPELFIESRPRYFNRTASHTKVVLESTQPSWGAVCEM